MPDKMKPGPSTPVRSLSHDGATRPNIPTAELESFARAEEKRPTILRYPRDPTLDPQLVWKGKDEQDGHDLEVPAVPIYIQETIDPLSLVEDLRATSDGRRTEQQLGFFAPYSEMPFDEKVDFYKHANKWSNRMILGDSLLVMTSLAEKEGLKGQVQTIYVDPPYGIKFGSNWQVSTRKRDVRDGKDTDLTRQPEQVRAYRDTWELGIHSYLSYLRDRLVVARDLLSESGSVFVQIGDENVHLVRAVLDEVFDRLLQDQFREHWRDSEDLRSSRLVRALQGEREVSPPAESKAGWRTWREAIHPSGLTRPQGHSPNDRGGDRRRRSDTGGLGNLPAWPDDVNGLSGSSKQPIYVRRGRLFMPTIQALELRPKTGWRDGSTCRPGPRPAVWQLNRLDLACPG